MKALTPSPLRDEAPRGRPDRPARGRGQSLRSGSTSDLEAAFKTAIAAAVERACGEPVVWGETDCLMFPANIYRDVLGRDPAAPWRGRYKTRRGALRVMGRGGVVGTIETAAATMGWPEIEVAEARVGDLGVIATQLGPAGAVFDGRFWVGHVELGFSAWARPLAHRAWRVA